MTTPQITPSKLPVHLPANWVLDRPRRWDDEPKPTRIGVGKTLIEAGHHAECYICHKELGNVTYTWRYCYHCKRGACQGQHGDWYNGLFVCTGCQGKKKGK